MVFKDVPGARATLRRLLSARLPDIYDLINEVVLKTARQWLRDNGGYNDLVIIVDQLDRIPQKIINDRGLTNHEHLFLDNAGTLRGLACDVLYTIPIELAYSRCRGRLRDTYGSDILSLPMILVKDRNGAEAYGLEILREIVRRRTAKAGLTIEEVFSSPEQLTRLCRLSGGHVRSLFILLRAAIERCAGLPIPPRVVEASIRRAAEDFAIGLGVRESAVLNQVHSNHEPPGKPEDAELWNTLLRDLFAFTYQDEQGIWYDRNPLLSVIEPSGAR
jgi:hypothetical protein